MKLAVIDLYGHAWPSSCEGNAGATRLVGVLNSSLQKPTADLRHAAARAWLNTRRLARTCLRLTVFLPRATGMMQELSESGPFAGARERGGEGGCGWTGRLQSGRGRPGGRGIRGGPAGRPRSGFADGPDPARRPSAGGSRGHARAEPVAAGADCPLPRGGRGRICRRSDPARRTIGGSFGRARETEPVAAGGRLPFVPRQRGAGRAFAYHSHALKRNSSSAGQRVRTRCPPAPSRRRRSGGGSGRTR